MENESPVDFGRPGKRAALERGKVTLKLIWAIVVGLSTIVVGILALLQYLKRPNLSITSNGPVVMSYSNKENLLEIRFGIVISNNGDSGGFVIDPTARLYNLTLPQNQNYIPFDSTSIMFYASEGRRTNAPIAIEKDTSKVMSCVLSHRFGQFSKSVIEKAGNLRLCVNILDQDGKSNKQEFCFKTNGDLLKPRALTPQQFDTVTCETGGCP